jgi:hypothetical protein
VLEEAGVVLAAAFRARAVAGGEGGGVVEEEELGVAARLQQSASAVLELEAAGDPAAQGVGAADPAVVVVEGAAVAVDESARRVGDELAEGGDAVLVRHEEQESGRRPGKVAP